MDMGETDAVLVARVRRGDPKAFDQLVRRHLRAAHAAARARLNDPEEADDVCQDAFIKALQGIDTCRDPQRFRAWLLTIVRNTANNRRDYNKVRKGSSMDVVDQLASSNNPYEDARRTQLRGKLSDAMGGLTELQRRVLVLHDLEGWKHAEIASQLGISSGSSRVHLHVARKAMRKLLSGTFAMEGC